MSNSNNKQLRQSIAQYLLNDGEYLDPVEVAMALQCNTQETKKMLNDMTIDGEAIEIDGTYSYLTPKTGDNNPLGKQTNPPLTERERSEFKLLKNNVSKAFYIVGASLGRIRNLHLYREQYSTFEEFCQTEFGYTRQHVNRLILGAEIVEDLRMTNCCQTKAKMEPNGFQTRTIVLPTAERQMRPLVKIKDQEKRTEKEKRVEAWVEAVDRANGKVPPARIVEQVVKETVYQEAQEKITGKRPEKYFAKQDSLKVGSVVKITSKLDPDLKIHHNYWGIIDEVRSIEDNINNKNLQLYNVIIWNAYVSNLREMDLIPLPKVDKRQTKALLDRLRHVNLKVQDTSDSFLFEWLNTLARTPNPRISPFVDFVLRGLEEGIGGDRI